MIVEVLFAGMVVTNLIVGPIKGWLLAGKTADLMLDKPKPRIVTKKDGTELEFFVEDFIDEKGKEHTDFHWMKVETSHGTTEDVILSKSEFQLMENAGLIELYEEAGMPVTKEILKSTVDCVQSRVDEIARTTNRRRVIRR